MWAQSLIPKRLQRQPGELDNLSIAISREDRSSEWLPFAGDLGLGCVKLSPFIRENAKFYLNRREIVDV